MRLCVLFLLALLGNARFALAGDIAAPAPVVTKAIAASACTPVSCNGFYMGGTFGGSGTNLDIVGSGVNNSIFAGGGVAAFDLGYQWTTPAWFLGLEGAVGGQFNTNSSVNNVSGNASGLLAYQIGKAGGNISALFGSQAPITIPPQLAASQIGAYLLTGAVERQFATGWASGAGAEFDVGPHSFVDLKYMHVQYGPSSNGRAQLSNEDLVLVGLNYKW